MAEGVWEKGQEFGFFKSSNYYSQTGNDLQVSIIGTNDQMLLKNWYSGSQYQLDEFVTSSGATLLDSQVDALVSAMAAFSPPAQGQLALSAEQHTALDNVIAANWQ